MLRDVPMAAGLTRRRFAALGLVAAALLAPSLAIAADLTLRICGFENRVGNLRIAVFAREHASEFTNPLSDGYAFGLTLALHDENESPVLRVVVPSLLPGDYAVRITHDQNANGMMDVGSIVGSPKEPYGYSRNARARIAAIDFDDAMVHLGDEPLSVDVRLVRWSLKGGDASPCPP